MDAALTPRAYQGSAPALPRIEAAAIPSAVPTVLPQDQSVAAAAEHSAGRFDERRRQRGEATLADEVLREIERDIEFTETNDIIDRVVDKETGQVLRQLPAESLLKLRAYVHEQLSPEEAAPKLVREA